MTPPAPPERTPAFPAAPLAAPGLPPTRFSALRSIAALMLREMGSTYGRSPGGYLWAILEPLGAITVMAVAFSLILRNPPIGTSFILFFATGHLAFSLYGTIAQKVQTSLRYSRALLAYPRVTWLDAVLARFLLNGLTELTVFALVMTGILMIQDTHAILDIVPILQSLGVAALLGLGVGLVNGLLSGLIPLWPSLWGIVTRPLFIASGVLFLYESMPPVVQSVLWWNPLIHVTALMRSGFYTTYDPAFVSLPYCCGVALVLIAAGLLCMRAWYKLVLEQ